MRTGEILRTVTSRAGVVRVRNALNPLLWWSSVAPVAWVFANLLRDDLIIKYGLVILGSLPSLCIMVAYLLCFAFDRDRLQSEEFILRQKELEFTERKSMPPVVQDQIITDQRSPVIEASPDRKADK